MKKPVLLIVFVLMLASYATFAFSVQAADWPPHNPYVWVEDEDGNMRDEFLPGENLTIKAYDSTVPYNITLIDPNNNTRKQWTSPTVNFDSGLLTDVTDTLGRWTVMTKNKECKFAVGMYNVIPEVTFGILGVLAACFAGFGIKSLKARRNL